jgi:hypothetical protein
MISRRGLLASASLALPLAGSAKAAEAIGSLTPRQRELRAFERRRDAAQTQMQRELPISATNGDEDRYPDRRASFSKTLPHDENGEVDAREYHRWLAILASGDPKKFDLVPRDAQAVERLNNPQAAYAIDLLGADPASLALEPPSAFASKEMAAEMAELYWLALMRDIPFRDYSSDPLAAAAAAELGMLGLPQTSLPNLFRGESAGEGRGPFVSQFLWRDIPYGPTGIVQRYRSPTPGQSFVASFEEWLACQRGAASRGSITFGAEPRYIASYRDLIGYVHRDFSFQAFMNAALIVLAMGGGRSDDVLSPTNPYRGSRTQFGDITFGNKNLLTLIAEASLLAQKTAYYQKWQVHRRARPEVIGARIEAHLTGRKAYDLHPAILQSEGLSRIEVAQDSWLLPQAYPEGCPTHPSYPAAHAVNAGACATVLKAFFDESRIILDPVEASADGSGLEPWRGEELTLSGEIDKLAGNIALARDAAGVHFRSDSVQGLRLGEEVAISLLADTSRTYNEAFDGFTFSRFDGTKVAIANGTVQSL